MTTTVDDPLLGFALPHDRAEAVTRTALDLVDAAERVGVLLRRVASMLPVQRWSGTASLAADRELAATAAALLRQRMVLLAGAASLGRFAAGVAAARESADEARRLVSAARSVQRSADLLVPAADATGWAGSRLDGTVRDPAAVALLDKARLRAYDARTTYDAAARLLTSELTDLSGRQVVRAGLSPRLLLDVVGFVPLIGDAVDLGNSAAYALQGRWDDAAITAVAAVPGPEGWAAASAKVGKAVSRTGEVLRVVDDVRDVSAQVRVAEVLAGLTVRGRRAGTRLAPDDDAVTRLFDESFRPLGTTTVTRGSRGDVHVTHLPGGGRVSYRSWSRCGGATIEFEDLPGVDVERIHRDC